jgi:hypothetical protein
MRDARSANTADGLHALLASIRDDPEAGEWAAWARSLLEGESSRQGAVGNTPRQHCFVPVDLAPLQFQDGQTADAWPAADTTGRTRLRKSLDTTLPRNLWPVVEDTRLTPTVEGGVVITPGSG